MHDTIQSSIPKEIRGIQPTPSMREYLFRDPIRKESGKYYHPAYSLDDVHDYFTDYWGDENNSASL